MPDYFSAVHDEPPTEKTKTVKKEKHVTIEAMFPELKGGSIYKVGRGSATGVKPAIARAFGGLLKQVKGKRFQTIKATVTIISSEVE
jgi:hypothetical protein